MRKMARLTAEVIDLGVAAVTAPAKWASKCLRWYADQGSERPPSTTAGLDVDDGVVPE
jgi:hypothetical protein